MRVTPTERLPEVFLIAPAVHADERGLFLEWQRGDRFAQAGLPTEWAQANHSRSQAGVLRGLHFQHPRAQGKLVKVTAGAVLDIAVDVRVGSPTFGAWTGAELSGTNHHMLYVPEGFAHGFAVIDGPADLVYLCTRPYAPEAERVLVWNDPDVGVEWPIANPRVSARDARGATLSELVGTGALPPFRAGVD